MIKEKETLVPAIMKNIGVKNVNDTVFNLFLDSKAIESFLKCFDNNKPKTNAGKIA